MKYRYPIDWIWQGHCLNCGQELIACICLAGPTHPRSLEELKKERDAVFKVSPKQEGKK